MDVSQLDPEHVRAIRRLDVAYAHRFNRSITGHAFLPGASEVSGKMYSADETALLALHKLRTKVGTKKQARESREWLRAEGLTGLFGQPLDQN